MLCSLATSPQDATGVSRVEGSGVQGNTRHGGGVRGERTKSSAPGALGSSALSRGLSCGGKRSDWALGPDVAMGRPRDVMQ
mmetsp:Transcript_82114/g.259127  ORF Transcript_82114/g.259127 Transcript_82114/m.259127 type:complete len:81 (+) Transcript_82114:346-588(+)